MSSDAQAIVDVALASAEPTEIDPDQRYAIVVPDAGQLAIIEQAPDAQRANPRRVVGTTAVLEPEGFGVVWDKHSADTSEVYADPVQASITAVFDADSAAGEAQLAGWRQHRAVLSCKLTPAYMAWASRDGRLMEQQDFAEHIEDRLADIVRPSGADMLEIAQSLQANTRVEFKSAVQVSSGQRGLVFEETTTAKAGQKGQLDIPVTFDLGLPIFEGGAAYKLTARFRYRINNGHLSIGYKLERPEDTVREAFKDVVTAVEERIGRSVLLGTAPRSAVADAPVPLEAGEMWRTILSARTPSDAPVLAVTPHGSFTFAVTGVDFVDVGGTVGRVVLQLQEVERA